MGSFSYLKDGLYKRGEKADQHIARNLLASSSSARTTLLILNFFYSTTAEGIEAWSSLSESVFTVFTALKTGMLNCVSVRMEVGEHRYLYDRDNDSCYHLLSHVDVMVPMYTDICAKNWRRLLFSFTIFHCLSLSFAALWVIERTTSNKWFLECTRVNCQMASRSVQLQPFLQGTSV